MKQKILLEYQIKSSPKLLYTRLSTPGGLSEWFADDVNLKGNIFSFVWEGTEQKAEMINKKENKYVRFRWLDETENYFEFRVNVDELTQEVALIITDFVEPDEKDSAIELWNSQVAELKHIIGL
jgi:uncharacterized protein YndB with AHSA1/START domain